MNLVNGTPSDAVSLQDRGWSYGDGAFRTFVLRNGQAYCWPRQYAKLREDCGRLGIDCPAVQLFNQDLGRIALQHPDCVIRITVTRGNGERGYHIGPDAIPTRVVATYRLPTFPAEYETQGIRACLCRTRLAVQPALAGIKHLNRLENILARSEWNDPDTAEGIMCDTDANVISGTMSNVFAMFGTELATPDVSRCGVSGVQRQRVLELAGMHGIPTHIETFDIPRLLCADEIFIVNSVINIWQVTAIEQKRWGSGTMTPKFRRWLNNAGD